MKKIITIAACIAAFVTLSAQNDLHDPFGIGTLNPQAQLHIHQSVEVDDPLIPLDPNPGGRDFSQDNYLTTFLMTNENCSSHGFSIEQYNKDILFDQKSNGNMMFQTPGGIFMLSRAGRFGFGDTVSTHMFNVQGTARFGSAVKMTQSLTVDGGVTIGGSLFANGLIYATNATHLNGTLDVGGATHMFAPLTVHSTVSITSTLSVGSGFQCDAQGNLKVKHLKVTLTSWPDYVFSDSHTLMPLNELEAYVNEYSHLPGVPSAKDVEENGADLGEMNKVLMEKVEELTLYIIDLQKQINEMKSNK